MFPGHEPSLLSVGDEFGTENCDADMRRSVSQTFMSSSGILASMMVCIMIRIVDVYISSVLNVTFVQVQSLLRYVLVSSGPVVVRCALDLTCNDVDKSDGVIK